MKAAIITLHSVSNYGTQLQAFATQEKLKEFFDEVEFINYQRPDTYGVGLLKTFTKGSLIKAPIILPTLFRWKTIFGSFQKKYLNIGEKKFLKFEDFNDFEDKFDVYFSGSDQVWNTGWNNGIIPPFYLSFVPNSKPRYSYSSSFGKDCLSKEEIAPVKKYLKLYKKITVREETAVQIINKQLGINNAFRIVDPTLAFAKDFWKKYEKGKIIKGEYILIYNLNRNKELDNYAKELAKRTGYKLYRFCTRYDQMIRSGKSIVIPKIFDFVTLIDNAKIVLTDSFHATAFSINMNTEPICVFPKKYSSRLSDFLKLVNLEDRQLKNYDDFDLANNHIDFTYANKVLANERKKINDFLNDVIKEIKKDERK